MNALTTSAVFSAHYYRGYVLEPTPLGQWMFYPERLGAEEAITSHAYTIDDAVRQIDALEDGEPDAPMLTAQNIGGVAAVVALTLAAIVLFGMQ